MIKHEKTTISKYFVVNTFLFRKKLFGLFSFTIEILVLTINDDSYAAQEIIRNK